MGATRIPPPPFGVPFLDGGQISSAWQLFLDALYQAAYGEGFDKTNAAYVLGQAAAPSATQVVVGGGLQGGSDLTGNVGVGLYVAICPVASLPTTGVNAGDWAYARDGRKTGEASGAGTGVPVWRSAGGWYAVDSGAVVTS